MIEEWVGLKGLMIVEEGRMQGELEVDENPVSSNGLCYATVRDTIKD